MDSSSDNNLTGNTTSGNQATGIWLGSSSSNNLISENTSCNNGAFGIALWGCPNNTVSDNTFDDNTNIGIVLDAGCDYTTVQGNSSTNNPIGITINSSSNDINNNSFNDNSNCGIQLVSSANNSIDDNIISGNQNAGIWLEIDPSRGNSSSDNTITGNFITENRYWGIFFSNDCNNQTIYNNYFNNFGNVYLAGTNVGGTWSTTLTAGSNIVGGPYLGGNYWGKPDNTGFSQTTADTNLDGICDSTNNLTPTNSDSLPLHNVTPIVTTEVATSISYESATFNGTVKSGGSPATVVFEYGLTTDYTSVVDAEGNPFAGFDTTTAIITVNNLQEGTSYHYRIKAGNSEGVTYGDDQTFETTTLETMYINKDDITCNGNSPCETFLQDGIDAANTIHGIKITGGNYGEHITLDSAKRVILHGGYDETYSFQQGTTKIYSLFISDGCLNVYNISLEP